MDAATQFLCTLRASRPEMLTRGPTEREAEIIRRHAAYLSALAERGEVLLAGRTLEDDERTRGIVILYAKDPSDAERLVREDPAVAEGVMIATIQPFRVAIRAPDHAR